MYGDHHRHAHPWPDIGNDIGHRNDEKINGIPAAKTKKPPLGSMESRERLCTFSCRRIILLQKDGHAQQRPDQKHSQGYQGHKEDTSRNTVDEKLAAGELL